MLTEHLRTTLPFDTIESKEYEGLRDTLLISCPSAVNTCGLALISEGKLINLSITGCLGMWLERNQLWVSTATADHMHLKVFEPGQANRTIINSQLGEVHDIRIFKGDLYAVSTATNEVVTLDLNGNILKRWTFNGSGDSWHVNCLDVWDGKMVVSAFGKFATFRGYKGKMEESGIVFDLHTQEILLQGFSAPHTPRQDESSAIYVCNSSNETLDCKKDGTVKKVRFPGAFTRGMAFSNETIYVGLSSPRHRTELLAKPAITSAQVAVLSKNNLDVIRTISLPQAEIYDIIAIGNS